MEALNGEQNTEAKPMLTADLRCRDHRCNDRDIYRMVGSCVNCGTKDVLMLFTVTHDAIGPRTCPICRTDHLRADRLAADDEFPEA